MPDPSPLSHVAGLAAHLRSRIRGQDHVLPRIAAAMCRGFLGLTSPDRPRASLLLVGPTGTGKSECFACAIEYLHGAGRLVSFDMSEYQDRRSLAKFLGESRDDPGLFGRTMGAAEEGGILFDEIEKAHPAIFDVMLQLLWHGRVTVATGQTLQLNRHFVGFTSNLGGAEAMRMERSTPASVESAVLRAVERSLRPELLARFDEKCVFTRLGPDVQREICALEVAREGARLRALGHDLAVSGEAMEFLIREGFHPQLGARNLQKAVERHMQDAVVRSLLESGTARGQLVPEPPRQQRLVILRTP